MAKPAPVVLHIFIGPNKGKPMQSVATAHAIEGLGLEGDRYWAQRGSWIDKATGKHKPKRNMTLMSATGIARANQTREEPQKFKPSETRRNLIIMGLDVNELIGKEFRIGSTVRCKGVEYAKPCERPSKLSGKPGFEEAFHGNGGVNCQILVGGEISVGDKITILEN